MVKVLALLISLGFSSVACAVKINEGPVKLSESEVTYAINYCNQARNIDSLIHCLRGEYARIDRILNHNYGIVVETLEQIDQDEPGRDALRKMVEAQRAWLAYRDSDAIFIQNGESPRIDLDPDKIRTEHNFVNSHKYAEAGKLVSMIISTYQRSNILYQYFKCEEPVGRFCPIALG